MINEAHQELSDIKSVDPDTDQAALADFFNKFNFSNMLIPELTASIMQISTRQKELSEKQLLLDSNKDRIRFMKINTSRGILATLQGKLDEIKNTKILAWLTVQATYYYQHLSKQPESPLLKPKNVTITAINCSLKNNDISDYRKLRLIKAVLLKDTALSTQRHSLAIKVKCLAMLFILPGLIWSAVNKTRYGYWNFFRVYGDQLKSDALTQLQDIKAANN